MKPQIIYHPRSRRPGIVKRPTFTPFAQDAPQKSPGFIGRQIIDYLKFGKPITAPITPIQTEVVVPPETKKFARQIVFTVIGGGLAAIVLYQLLK